MNDNSSSNITRWFLTIGKIEGYSYLLLLFIAMPLKYVFGQPQWVRIAGSLHGALFVAFMAFLFLMWQEVKMPLGNAVKAFILSLIPFGTFFLKRLV